MLWMISMYINTCYILIYIIFYLMNPHDFQMSFSFLFYSLWNWFAIQAIRVLKNPLSFPIWPSARTTSTGHPSFSATFLQRWRVTSAGPRLERYFSRVSCVADQHHCKMLGHVLCPPIRAWDRHFYRQASNQLLILGASSSKCFLK